MFPHAFWDKEASSIALVPAKGETLQVPEDWLVCSKIRLQGKGGGEALLGFMTGAAGARMEQDVAGVAAESMAVFRKLYGTEKVPDPIHVLGSSWLLDRYSMGAYSFSGAGFDEKYAEAVKIPIEGKIWLAGEYTNSDGHRGYVHGGLLEGRRAAEELVAAGLLGK